MTEVDKLSLLRVMVGQPANSENWSDDVLISYLKIAGEKIINRAYPYDDTVTEVPRRYGALQCEIAAYLLNRRGSEGQLTHIENGISRTYDSSDVPESLLSNITPFCNVMAIVKRLENLKFGRLTVIKEVGRNKSGSALWLCKCDCGGEKIVSADRLKSGMTRSCGCIKREQNLEMFTSHGESNTSLYKVWASVKNRCNNPNEPKYANYGGRGIKVCPEWEKDFLTFKEWCLTNGYEKGLTIERMDVNGNYSPSNCVFATQKVQQNNRRNNHLISFNGVTKTLSQWAEYLGMKYKALEHRINRGWSVEDAFTIPIGGKRYANTY